MTARGKEPKAIGLLEYVIYVVLILPAVEGLRLIDRLGCPSDAFICGSESNQMNAWAGLLRVVLLMAALFYPARLLLYAATRNRWLRRKFDGYFRRFDLRTTLLRGAMATVLLVPAIVLLTHEQVWATATAIDEREYAWSVPVRRGWDQVIAVSTWCERGSRGRWDKGYDLIFRDRGDIDLAVNQGPLVDQRAAIFAALHGRRFAFDTSAVDKDCPADFRAMATTRP